jgi:hypothetical protein
MGINKKESESKNNENQQGIKEEGDTSYLNRRENGTYK